MFANSGKFSFCAVNADRVEIEIAVVVWFTKKIKAWNILLHNNKEKKTWTDIKNRLTHRHAGVINA